jgi:hypothetical protein
MSNLIGLHVHYAGVHFVAVAPCGASWLGKRHSDDVRTVLDKAMDHVPGCDDCRDTPSPVYATRRGRGEAA